MAASSQTDLHQVLPFAREHTFAIAGRAWQRIIASLANNPIAKLLGYGVLGKVGPLNVAAGTFLYIEKPSAIPAGYTILQ
jgi:hypothetical protein